MLYNPSDFWQKTLSVIRTKLDSESFQTWFSPTTGIYLDDERLVVEVPSIVFRDTLRSRFLDKIKNSLSEQGIGNLFVDFTCPVDSLDQRVTDPAENNFHDKFTFDTFVVGKSNSFCHAACLAVADAPAQAYNPLFIYGGVGLGKTHLIQAIGDRVYSKNPRAKVRYVSSEHFMNDLIESIRFNTVVQFRNRYRSADILLIDDVQFFADKERTQEEFFHTFNSLYDSQSQIVLTSDRPPKDIPTLEERLVSRFEWGLIADIQPPDLETRIAIIGKKAETLSLDLPQEVCMLIATTITTNIRVIEGALIRLSAHARLLNVPIDETLAESLLTDFFKDSRHIITVKMIQQAVGKYYKITTADLRSKSRSAPIAFARQVAIFITRQLTNFSLSDIGEAFGKRDHSTIIHSVEKINQLLTTNQTLRLDVDYLTRILRGGQVVETRE